MMVENEEITSGIVQGFAKVNMWPSISANWRVDRETVRGFRAVKSITARHVAGEFATSLRSKRFESLSRASGDETCRSVEGLFVDPFDDLGAWLVYVSARLVRSG